MTKKILVIDDVQEERSIMTRCLREAGYETVEAETGEDGVKKVEDEKPDVAIVDTKMTGIDGFETCKRIKKINNVDTKVIIVTGQIDAVDAGKASEMGADDYCVKTMDADGLVDAVKKLL